MITNQPTSEPPYPVWLGESAFNRTAGLLKLALKVASANQYAESAYKSGEEWRA